MQYDKQHLGILNWIVTTKIELKRYQEALMICDQLLALDLANARAHASKCKILMDLRRDKEALQEAEKAIELDSQLAQGYQYKGKLLFRQKRYNDALSMYQETLRLNPDFDSYYSAGLTFFNLKRYQEGEEALKTALTVLEQKIIATPQNASLFYSKGLVLLQLQSYEEALTIFDQAIALDPRSLYFAGRLKALWKLKRFKTVIKEFFMIPKLSY